MNVQLFHISEATKKKETSYQDQFSGKKGFFARFFFAAVVVAFAQLKLISLFIVEH